MLHDFLEGTLEILKNLLIQRRFFLFRSTLKFEVLSRFELAGRSSHQR